MAISRDVGRFFISVLGQVACGRCVIWALDVSEEIREPLHYFSKSNWADEIESPREFAILQSVVGSG